MEVAQFRFVITPESELILPVGFKGAVFRGAFGEALRQFSCNSRLDCRKGCLRPDQCFYYNVFEGRINSEGKSQTTPHPFVLRPPAENGKSFFSAGEKLCFDLILFGEYADQVRDFVLTFIKLGELGLGRERGRFTVLRVYSVSGDKEIVVYDDVGIFHVEKVKRIDLKLLLHQLQGQPVDRVRVRFLTPTRLMWDRKTIVEACDLSFGRLMYLVFSRLRALLRHWGGDHPLLRFDKNDRAMREGARNAAVRQAAGYLQEEETEYYSERQGETKVVGCVGEMVYEGEALGVYYPYLKLIPYVHLGNNTGFGVGQVEIEGWYRGKKVS